MGTILGAAVRAKIYCTYGRCHADRKRYVEYIACATCCSESRLKTVRRRLLVASRVHGTDPLFAKCTGQANDDRRATRKKLFIARLKGEAISD